MLKKYKYSPVIMKAIKNNIEIPKDKLKEREKLEKKLKKVKRVNKKVVIEKAKRKEVIIKLLNAS